MGNETKEDHVVMTVRLGDSGFEEQTWKKCKEGKWVTITEEEAYKLLLSEETSQ